MRLMEQCLKTACEGISWLTQKVSSTDYLYIQRLMCGKGVCSNQGTAFHVNEELCVDES